LIDKRGAVTQELKMVMIILFSVMFIALVIFWVTNQQSCEFLQTNCAARRHDYCMSWWKSDRRMNPSNKPTMADVNDCVDGDVTAECKAPTQKDCISMLYQEAGLGGVGGGGEE
jgi:hypothetical protein